MSTLLTWRPSDAYIVDMQASIGEFEVLVLLAVARLGEDGYAPAVREEIEQRTGRRVARGAVYVTLDRLTAKGLLVARVIGGEGGGRSRRTYRNSPRGLKAIKRTLAALEVMRDGLDPLLEHA